MNNDYANMHIALQKLKEQGIDTRQLEAVVREQQGKTMNSNMSSSDGIYIEQSQPDAPGFYIDEYMKQQEAYANQMEALNQDSQSNAPTSDMNAAEMYTAVTPNHSLGNPNYQAVQGPQRVTVGPRGELIYL